MEDALEEWGEYHREPKLKGALSYLDQCIVDWDEEDLKNPSAYSWDTDRIYSLVWEDWRVRSLAS